MRDLFAPPLRHLRNRLRARQTPRGNIDTYVQDFPASAQAFRSFLRNAPTVSPTTPTTTVGVIVSSWVSTPVPWYAMALALGLAARGRAVTFIWDDVPFPKPSDAVTLQNDAIGKMLYEQKQFPVVRLSDLAPQPLSAADEAHVTSLAGLNLVWHLRGATPNAAHLKLQQEMRASLGETLARAHTLYEQAHLDYMIQGGGVYGGSSMLLEAGRQAGVRVATFDANFGVIQIASEGIAAQQTDIPRAFRIAQQWDAGTRERALAQARAEFQERAQGRDRAQYQAAARGETTGATDVLIPLNVEFDSAALGRHIIFENTRAWILDTVEFILRESNATVSVRQHPAERKKNEGGKFDLSAALAEQFPNEPRLRYIAAADPVNSYDLLEQARLVLPFASTIGYEAVALGKPVIVAGASCYSDLGFVHKPSSRAEYFERLGQGLRGELTVSDADMQNAWLCYYLTPVCARVWTDFTPQPPDFWKWVKRPPLALYAEPEVQDILTALDENIPLSLVRHTRMDSA